MRKLLILLLAAGLGGCSIYRLEIQQGNVIEQKDLARLHTGMDKQQVVFLMGTPLLNDPFHKDRWDYVYLLRNGKGEVSKRRRVTLYFSGDTLARIEPGPGTKLP